MDNNNSDSNSTNNIDKEEKKITEKVTEEDIKREIDNLNQTVIGSNVKIKLYIYLN